MISIGLHVGFLICLPVGPPIDLCPVGSHELFWGKNARDLRTKCLIRSCEQSDGKFISSIITMKIVYKKNLL